MSKTIIAGDNDFQMDVFALNLKAFVGSEVTLLNNVEKVGMFLELDSTVDLIIVYDKIKENENCSKEIYEHLQRLGLKTPLIILGKNEEKIPCVKVFPENVELKQLIRTVAQVFDVTAQDMVKISVGEYYPIPLNLFNKLQNSVCDVFVRMELADGGHQYLRKYKKGEDIANMTLEKYQKNGINNLYVPSIERLSFTNFISDNMIDRLKSKNISSDDRLKDTDVGMNLVIDELASVGLTENSSRLASVCISSIKSSVEEHPKLRSLLSKIINSPGSWIYKYCQILTYVAHHIIDASDWGSEEQKEKISFAIFFQDMPFLVQKLKPEKLVTIYNNEELQLTSLNELEHNVVLQHAVMASNVTKEFEKAPFEIDVIIKQHHGTYNGIGFSDHIAPSISHLAQVIVVAQDFTREILNIVNEDTYDLEEVVKTVRARYSRQRLLKIVDGLNTIKF